MKRSAPTAPHDEPAVPKSPAPFPYQDYVQAREILLGAVRQGPLYAVLTGGSGMGKSSLLGELSAALDRQRHVVVYLSCSRTSLPGLCRFLAQALHVVPRRTHVETAQALAEALASQAAQLVLLLDEADRLPLATLQEVRVLAECGLPGKQLFGAVLSGLPTLTGLLDTPDFFPLKRRITLTCDLRGLRREELEAFLAHRFGPDQRRLPHTGQDDLFERTQATPGLIDKVVRLALAATPGRLSQEDLHAALDRAGL